MSFFDVFNLSFVVYLGILILCLSLLFVYFESKLREQNHKMSNILQIVSTLAQEVHSAPQPSLVHNSIESHPLNMFEDVKKLNTSLDLIDVSDGEDLDDEEEGYEEEEDEEEEDEDDEIEDLNEGETESESESEGEGEESESESEESEMEDLDRKENDESEVEDLERKDENENENDNLSVDGIDIVEHLDNNEDVAVDTSIFVVKLDEELKEFDDFHVIHGGDDDAHSISSDFEEKENKVDETKSDDLKSIILSANISVYDGAKSLSADEGSVIGDEFTKDFKKMSQNKLKKLAVEKGLIQENSKLKKPELISLLEKSV